MIKNIPTNLKAEIDAEKLMFDSPMFWSVYNIRLPKGDAWDFQNRAWQPAIFDDPSQNIVVLKPTQVGMTTIMLCKMLHFATFHNVRVMYTLPRQDDVYDLVNGRLERMIATSPVLHSGIGTIDNVRLKVYRSSFLHFMESSVTPRMLDVDLLVNDEVDMSNQDNLEQYIARLDASKYKIQYRISTPTIPDFGISKSYDQSDQKRWLVKCRGCNHYQELNWENNVAKVKSEPLLVCGKCGKQLTPEDVNKGVWVPAYPGRDISGYSVSQLMTPTISLKNLQRDFDTMRPKNFYNLRMGVPYTQNSGGFSRFTIMSTCFTSEHNKLEAGSGFFIGADQGNDIYVVVLKLHNSQIQIVNLQVIPMSEGFDELERIFHKYNTKKMVVDALPNRHSALRLVQALPSNRARVAFYTRQDKYFIEVYNSEQININRSIAFDVLNEKIVSGEIQFYGSRARLDTNTRMAITHLVNLKRQEVSTNTIYDGSKIEMTWVNTGPDHFAHALNYALIALQSSSGSFKVVDLNNTNGIADYDNGGPYNNNPYYNKANALSIIQKRRQRMILS